MATPEPKHATSDEQQRGEGAQTTEELAVATVEECTVEEHHDSEERGGVEDVHVATVEEQVVHEEDAAAAEVDESVAATLGSSLDGDSVHTEDFADEETFDEESSKVAEVDFATLAAEEVGQDNTMLDMLDKEDHQVETVANADVAEESAADVNSTVDDASEMDFSVAATIGSSVDADSVFSLDDMRDSISNDAGDATDSIAASVEEEVADANNSQENAETAVKDRDTAVETTETTVVEASDTQVATIIKEDTMVEETSQEGVVTETTTVTQETVRSVDETTSESSEVKTSDEARTALVEQVTELAPTSANDAHAEDASCEAAPATQDAEAEEPEHEADDAAPEASEQTPKKKLPTLITQFADKVTTKTGAHRTESAAKLELNPPSPVRELVHHLEFHEEKPPQTHRTPSAAKLDLSGASPVKHAVHHLESHQEEADPLGNLKFRTKRDFFSERERSISVSKEKQKYNDLMAQRAKEEAEAKEKSPAKKQGPGPKKSAAMSSVRNMASRFEKKAEQSLDNLSFRTVRSFFPTEKSVRVGAEKQKYEALEKEKQAAKEAEEKTAKRPAFEESHKSKEQKTDETAVVPSTDTKEPTTEESVTQEKASVPDAFSTPTKDTATTTAKLTQTPEPYSRRHTVADSESPGVRGMAQRFESKRAQSVVTRTVDSFFSPDASVRVSAEKEKFEALEKQVMTAAPTVRTVDTFFAPDASVRVSAEKEKFEALEKQVMTAAPTVRTVDTFFAPDASVRVSAEKEKFEALEKQVMTAAPTVRTVDTFFAPDASVRVSAEKEKFEALEKQMQSAAPAVRTVDTFFVPESEVSVRVAAEKAKLEALQKQKQEELEVQAAIEKQNSDRAKMAAMAKKAVDKVGKVEEVKEVVEVTSSEEVPATEKVEEVAEATESEEVKNSEEMKVAEEVTALKDESTEKTEEVKIAEEVVVEVATVTGSEDAQVELSTIEQTEELKAVKVVEEVGEITTEVTTTKEENAEVKVPASKDAEKVGTSELVEESDEVKGQQEVKAAEVVAQIGVGKVSVVDSDSKTEVVEEPQEIKITEQVTQTVEVKGDKVVTATETVKVVEEVKIEEVKTTEQPLVAEEIKVTGEGDLTELVKETKEVTTTEESTDTEVVKVVEEIKTVEQVQVVEEDQVVEQNATVVIEQTDTSIAEEVVTVGVRDVTFSDVVSTIQHAQWLSLPASANPALARLHTMLSEHDPLTTFALYPPSPPSPSSHASDEDLPLPDIPTSAPPTPSASTPKHQARRCKSARYPESLCKISMQASRSDKFAFLEPWCAVLRGRLTSEGRFSDHSALGEYWFVSVRFAPSLMAILNREASDVRLLREALELLSLVAMVDNEAWKFLLVQRCDLKLDDDDTLDGVFEPRFLLRFDAEHLRYSALLPSATIRQFFLPRTALHRTTAAQDGTRTSAGFQDALFSILAFHRAAGGRPETVARWRKIPYALQFADYWNLGQPVLTAHLTALLVTLDEIRQHNEWLTGARGTKRQALMIDEDGNETLGPLVTSEDDGTADGHYFVYELESVQMCLGTIQVSRDVPNVFLTTLGMPSVAISELQLSLEQEPQTALFRPGEVHPRDLAAHSRCGMLFNTIFCGRSITSRPNDQPQAVRRSSIKSVVIPQFGMDDQTFSGLCSSLAESTEVRKLAINGAFRPLTPAQRTWRWQWLAYALFSGASRSSIEEINLMGVQLSTADVDAIAQVLATNVPEPGQATATAEAVYAEGGRAMEYVYIPKGTRVHIQGSIASPNPSTSLVTVDDFIFRLLQNDEDSDGVNVLVPGRGVGLIDRAHIRNVTEDEVPARRTADGITSLSLSIDSNAEQDMTVLIRLLELVGGSLQGLSIQTTRSVAMDVHGILKACPKLEQLILDSVQIDLESLLLQMENGGAQIRCFALSYYNSPPDAVTHFAKALADPHSALANTMLEVCLSADNEEFPMTDESVQAFLDVLKTNNKLMYLDLLVLPPLFDKYATAFRQHHQELLCVEKEKLPLRCRLAFLSVVRGHSTLVNDTLLHLDNNLLQIIFSFAAVSAKRTVCLRCDH